MLKLVPDFEGLGGGLVHKVRTLLQWDLEARGGVLYSQTPYLSTYGCLEKLFSSRNFVVQLGFYNDSFVISCCKLENESDCK